jgi:hypothetical protein
MAPLVGAMLLPSNGRALLAKTGMKRVEGLASLTGSRGFIRGRQFIRYLIDISG